MSEEIFRKKSLDKVKSPESLDDYIRVSNPGVWLLLVSVIVLLLGACVWGIFGHIDSTVPTTVQIENGEATCFIGYLDLASVAGDPIGRTVKVSGKEAVITSIAEKSDLGCKCVLSAEFSLPDGFYDGRVVVDRYQPLSFILN